MKIIQGTGAVHIVATQQDYEILKQIKGDNSRRRNKRKERWEADQVKECECQACFRSTRRPIEGTLRRWQKYDKQYLLTKVFICKHCGHLQKEEQRVTGWMKN